MNNNDKEDFIKNESYEVYADNYMKGTEQKPWITHYERPNMHLLIDKYVNNTENKTILDCGCATGYYSKYFIDKGADVIAVDNSSAMVKITKERTDGKAKVYNADLNKSLNFIEDNSIDVIICSLVLQYIKDWTLIMSEFYRTMSVDGIIIASTHHPIMDYVLYKSDNYYDLKLVIDQWEGFDVDFTVKYYTRPLHKYIQPYIEAGFTLNEIFEPLPSYELMNKDLKAFNRLIQKPGFLFIVCRRC